MPKMIRFRSDLISGLLKNDGDQVGQLIRSWDNTTPVILCQGYGVSRSVPLRVLAYAVPVLRLARQLPRHTKIEFYWATHGVLRANNVSNPEEIIRSSCVARNLLASYIHTFHPDLEGQVRILEDMELGEDIERDVASLLAEAETIASEIPAIASFIGNRGGAAALKYMTEHALYMRDPIELEGRPLPLVVSGMSHPSGGHLVMIGGPSERVFWKLRQQLLQRKTVHGRWCSHQFFTGVGDPPTYHPQPGEPYADVGSKCHTELDLPTVLIQAGETGSGPLRDWLVLLQDAAGTKRFSITPTTKGGLTEQVVLQEGFGHLMKWLRSS